MEENLLTLNIEDPSDKQLEIIMRAFEELARSPLAETRSDDDQPHGIQREQMRQGLLEKLGMARTRGEE